MRNVTVTIEPPKRRVQFTVGDTPFKMYAGRPEHIQPLKPSAQCKHCNEDRQVHRVNNKCMICGHYVTMKPNAPGIDGTYCLRRYPRIVAHMICASLGYFCPSSAAQALADAIKGETSYSEMMMHCHKGNAGEFLKGAISHRHGHTGFMAHYPKALSIVAAALANLGEPAFASWF